MLKPGAEALSPEKKPGVVDRLTHSSAVSEPTVLAERIGELDIPYQGVHLFWLLRSSLTPVHMDTGAQVVQHLTDPTAVWACQFGLGSF